MMAGAERLASVKADTRASSTHLTTQAHTAGRRQGRHNRVFIHCVLKSRLHTSRLSIDLSQQGQE